MVTPLVASNVAVSDPPLMLPVFCKPSVTVTVSPGSMAPLFGEKLSDVRVAPAATIRLVALSTMVRTLAALFAGSGSGWSAVTMARFVKVTGRGRLVREVVLTTNETVALAPTPRFPKAQLRTLLANAVVPCEAAADTKRVFTGSVSFRFTPVAAMGPRFNTVSW